MKVVKPFTIDDSVLVSSDALEPNFELLEEKWSIYRDGSFLLTGAALTIVDISEFETGRFLGVNGSDGSVYVIDYSNDSYPSPVFKYTTLFTATGRTFDSVAYSYVSGFIMCQDSVNNDVYAYDKNGVEQWVVSMTASSTQTTICGAQDGFIKTVGVGSTSSAILYRESGLVFSFDIKNGASNALMSCTTDESFIYCLETTGHVSKFNLWSDNAAEVDRWYSGYAANIQGIAFEAWSNQICIYRDPAGKYIYKNGLIKAPSPLSQDNVLYRAGDISIQDGVKYTCLSSYTYDAPVYGSQKTTPTWKVIGNSNRYNMFNLEQSSQTVRDNSVSVTFNFSENFDSIGLFNIEGTQVNINHNGNNYVYDITGLDKLVIVDFFGVSGSNLDVTITNTGSVAKCGELIVGQSETIGEADYPVNFSLKDFSRVEEDEFGNTTIVKRRNVDIVDYSVTMPTDDVTNIRSVLRGLTTDVCLYVDDEVKVPVLGYYKDMNVIMSNPNVSNMSLKIQEVV